ncbi:MAG: hypothetical protein RI894_1200, partial [Bacteroidota bacterium]
IAEAYYYINRIGEQGCEVSTIVKNPVFKKFTSNNGNVSYNWDGQVKNNFYSIMHIEFKDTIADNKETKQALAVKYLDWLKNKFRFTSINDYIVGYNYPQKDWQAWGVSAYFKDENNPGGIRYAHAKCWVSQNFATILILSRKDELFNEADEQAFLDGFRHSTLIANYPETPFH